MAAKLEALCSHKKINKKINKIKKPYGSKLF
jgi:hypothetical protein